MLHNEGRHSAAGHRVCKLGLVGLGRLGQGAGFDIVVSTAGWRIFGRGVDCTVDIAAAGIG